MLCLYWKNTQTTLLMRAGNALSSSYSLCGWVHHFQGETLVRKTKPTKRSTALKVHPLVCIAYEGQVYTAWCSATPSCTHPGWGRVCSLTHSDAWPHWKLLSVSADTACSTRAGLIRECQRALTPRGLTFRNEIGQHTAMDLLMLGLCVCWWPGMPRHLRSYALADCVNDKVLCDRGLHLGFVITSAELGCSAQTSAT